MREGKMLKKSKLEIWLGIVITLALGVIHLVLARQEFDETPYAGVMFAGYFAASIIAAIGIYRDARLWGWVLGFLLAASAFIGYIISRTVGLPGMGVEDWLAPMGILSLVLEVAYCVLFFRQKPFEKGLLGVC
jgi:hypothetical protein